MLVPAQLNMTVKKKNTTNDKSSHFKLMTIILEKAFFLRVNPTFFFHFLISSVLLQLTLLFHLPSSDDDLASLLRMLKFKREISLFFYPQI